VVMNKFDLAQYLEMIQKHKATLLHVVPPVILALAKHPLVSKYDLSSLKKVSCGAAPLGKELQEEVEKRIPNSIFQQGYGMTELSPVSHAPYPAKVVRGSVGVLVPNCIAKIVDQSGKSLTAGRAGELCIKGPNVMKGYFNNPTATSNTIDADGFLRTGDIAMVDANGIFYIVDRLKELIKYKGFQVPPAELEDVLISHPHIADACVIPVVDVEAGEIPKAYVVLKPDAKISEEELKEWFDQRVSPYKKLRGGIKFVNEVPKSAAGKLLRRLLIERDRAELIRAKL